MVLGPWSLRLLFLITTNNNPIRIFAFITEAIINSRSLLGGGCVWVSCAYQSRNQTVLNIYAAQKNIHSATHFGTEIGNQT